MKVGTSLIAGPLNHEWSGPRDPDAKFTRLQYVLLLGAAKALLSDEPFEVTAARTARQCAGVLGFERSAVMCLTGVRGPTVVDESRGHVRQPASLLIAGDDRSDKQFLLPPDLPAGGTEFLQAYLDEQQIACGITAVWMVGSQTWVIGVYDRYPGRVSENDASFLQTVADLLADVARRRQVEMALHSDIKQTAAIAEIAMLVASTSSIAGGFGQFAGLLKRLVPFEHLAIWTRRQGSAKFEVAAVEGNGAGVLNKGEQVPDRHLPPADIANRPFVHAQSPTGLGIPPEPLPGFGSFIWSPLCCNGELAGYLVAGVLEPGAYSSLNILRIQQVALQVAGCLSNRNLLRQVERIALEQSIVATVGRLVESSSSNASTYADIDKALAQAIAFEHMALLLIDADRECVDVAYTSPGHERWRAGQALSIYSKRQEALAGLEAEIDRTAMASSMTVPLQTGGELIGILAIESKRTGAFAEQDFGLARRVAGRMANAIGRQKLNMRLEQEANQQTALADLGAAMTQAQDLNGLLESVHRGLGRLLVFDRVAVDLVDDVRWTLIRKFDRGMGAGSFQSEEETASFTPRTMKEMEVVLAASCDTSIPDDANDGSLKLLSRMQTQLRSRGNLIGRLVMWSRTASAYRVHDLDLLQRAAALIGPVIDNVRAYAALERQARERELLAEIGRVIGSSLEIEKVYAEFARLVHLLIPFDRIAISKLNMHEGTAEDLYQDGIRLPDRPLGLVRSLANTPAETLLRERRLVLDLREEISFIPGYEEKRKRMIGAGLWSCISVLLTSRDNFMASMDLSSTRVSAYSQSDLQLVERIASQVAGAIANASVYAQLMEREGRPEKGIGPLVPEGALRTISDTDLRILGAIASGLTNEEIARDLSFAVGTVKNRVGRIYRQIGVRDRAQAAAFAERYRVSERLAR